jgi:hypothetical protein
MNTTGIQNYLSNVFRPIVSYDTGTSNFTPKLEMSNIDTYSGNVVSVIRGDIGDSNGNVYVGLLSGNPIIDARACSGVSAFGYSAGSNISNCSNSVYLGTEAGATSSNNQGVISIGYQSGKGGNGVSNIFIGTGTKSTSGSSNIFLGHGIDLSSVSNQLRIGFGTSIPIAANISTKWVGLNGLVTPLDVGNTFDASGNVRIQGQLGINITPGGRTLDVNGNFRTADASANVLDFSNGLTRSSGGFASIQNDISVNMAATTIGTLKLGAVLVSAVNKNDSADHASRLVLAYTASNAVDVGSNVAAGDASITFNTSNIEITDTTNTTTYSYSITYFPLP